MGEKLDGRLKQHQEVKDFPVYGLKHLLCTRGCELISLSQGCNFSPQIFRVVSRIVKAVSIATSEADGAPVQSSP